MIILTKSNKWNCNKSESLGNIKSESLGNINLVTRPLSVLRLNNGYLGTKSEENTKVPESRLYSFFGCI